MGSGFTVCFLFFIAFNIAEMSTNSVISNMAQFNVEEAMAKVNGTCLTYHDYQELTGHIAANHHAERIGIDLLGACIETIGLNELRDTIGLPPLGAWIPFNRTWWNETDLAWFTGAEKATASTIQDYYKIKEPRDVSRSLNSDDVLETQMAGGMAFMEKRLPEIRRIFKYQFENIIEKHGGVVEKYTIDELIQMFQWNSAGFHGMLFYKHCP